MSSSVDALSAVKDKVLALHKSYVADSARGPGAMGDVARIRANTCEHVLVVLDEAMTTERAAGA